ncbi:glutamic acid-rich protein-like isoform X2 [Quillaja saponaria]|uniref:Glutamic acid-rich protein-like isoform X2 n=1 Tax=Quillaja saponaria TaxID=32244 RepID=A0AAD7QBU0_QUISA|nr:glutamic acid-rich protein-like isoform X2 [Quillaja saponaria]
MYDSSDNSRNIDKERMLWSQNGFHNRGRPTQIDFQLQKDQEPIANLDVPEKCGLASRLGKEQFCATSGISTFVTGKIDSKHGRELGGSPPAEIEFAAVNEVQTSSKSSFGKSGLLEMEREFRKLIVNWMPPSLQTENSDFDDQEWLFERTLSRTDTSKKMTANDQELYQGSYPHARYLPDADIYALPYTIIF